MSTMRTERRYGTYFGVEFLALGGFRKGCKTEVVAKQKPKEGQMGAAPPAVEEMWGSLVECNLVRLPLADKE